MDVWQDLEGMVEHYQETMPGMAGIFTGAPQGSIWEQPKSAWSEW